MRPTKNYISRSKRSADDDSSIFLGFEESTYYQSLKPVTKIIKKRSKSHKRGYTNIPNELRRELVEVVHQGGESIKDAARRLGINYSCAKAICQVYKREGRCDKKIPRNNGFKDQLTEGLHHLKMHEKIETNQQEAQKSEKECSEISKNEFLTSPPNPMQKNSETVTTDESLTIEEFQYSEPVQESSSFLHESRVKTQNFAPRGYFPHQEPSLYIEPQVNSLYNFNLDLGQYKHALMNPWPFVAEKHTANFPGLGNPYYQNLFCYSQPQMSAASPPMINMMSNEINGMKLFNPMYYMMPQNISPQIGYNGYVYAVQHNL